MRALPVTAGTVRVPLHVHIDARTDGQADGGCHGQCRPKADRNLLGGAACEETGIRAARVHFSNNDNVDPVVLVGEEEGESVRIGDGMNAWLDHGEKRTAALGEGDLEFHVTSYYALARSEYETQMTMR